MPLANILFQKFTGATTIAEALAPGVKFKLRRIELNLSSAATQETLTVTLDAGDGATYDTVLYSKAMAGVQDLIRGFDKEFEPDDEIDIAWDNSDTRTYGGRYVYELQQ